MRVVRINVGVPCAPVPRRGVIFIDPAFSRAEALIVIQAALPLVHPDAIEHWVEAVMPRLDHDDTVVLHFADRPVPSHRRPASGRMDRFTRSKLTLAAGALITFTGLGVGAYGMSIAAPSERTWSAGAAPLTGAQPSATDFALASISEYSDPVFAKVADTMNWSCPASKTDLDGDCVEDETDGNGDVEPDADDLPTGTVLPSVSTSPSAAPAATLIHTEMTIGATSHIFTFSYKLHGKAQIVLLRVFGDVSDKDKFLAGSQGSLAVRNLATGPNWAMYGSDPDRIKVWAVAIGPKLMPLSGLPGHKSTQSAQPTLSPSGGVMPKQATPAPTPPSVVVPKPSANPKPSPKPSKTPKPKVSQLFKFLGQ